MFEALLSPKDVIEFVVKNLSDNDIQRLKPLLREQEWQCALSINHPASTLEDFILNIIQQTVLYLLR